MPQQSNPYIQPYRSPRILSGGVHLTNPPSKRQDSKAFIDSQWLGNTLRLIRLEGLVSSSLPCWNVSSFSRHKSVNKPKLNPSSQLTFPFQWGRSGICQFPPQLPAMLCEQPNRMSTGQGAIINSANADCRQKARNDGKGFKNSIRVSAACDEHTNETNV